MDEKQALAIPAHLRATHKQRPKLALTVAIAVGVGAVALVGMTKQAHAEGAPGECATGFCGTPGNNGGGSACGCGSGVLVGGP